MSSNLLANVKFLGNSFDDCFTNYQQETKLYAYPLIFTNNAWSALDSSPLLWVNEKDGFYFINDRIITNANDPLDTISNRNLTLIKSTRFYSTYKEDQMEYYYSFLSKEASKAVFYFHHFYYPDADEIVGLITLYCKLSQASMVLLLTNKKINEDKYWCFDSDYYTFNLEFSPILQNLGTRFINMGLIFKLQRDLDYDSENDFYAWDSQDMANKLFKSIETKYNNLSDENKDICHLIIPERYPLIKNTNYTQSKSRSIVKRFINNTYNLVIQNYSIAGLLGNIHFGLNSVDTKLLEKTYTYVFGWPSIILNKEDTKQLTRNTVALYVINQAFSHVQRSTHVSSLWLYHNLFYLREQTEDELLYALSGILLQCTLYSNYNYFEEIISIIKNYSFKLKKLGFETTWRIHKDRHCLFELLYYFNEGISTESLNILQDNVLGNVQLISQGYDFQSIKNDLSRTIHHSFMGIEEEREFYAHAIYEYIESQIKIDPHFGEE